MMTCIDAVPGTHLILQVFDQDCGGRVCVTLVDTGDQDGWLAICDSAEAVRDVHRINDVSLHTFLVGLPL